MKLSSFRHLAVGVSSLLFCAYASAAPPVGYHLLKTVALPAAPGGIEYFDYTPVTHTLVNLATSATVTNRL